MSLQIIIAEDHPLILIGIQHLLAEYQSDAVLTSATDFTKTLLLLEKQKFDLMIMDINLPGGDRIGMVQTVRAKQPDIPILVCSSYDEHLYALPFLRAGANGYISKRAIGTEFLLAVDHVLHGRIYASPEVMKNAFEQLFNMGKAEDSITDKLSDKELEIAKLLSKGMSTKAISDCINLSPSSVSTYKTRIFEKLGVNNPIELTTYLELNH